MSMRRVLLVAALAALLVAPVARAWTWPVDGPVLQPFTFDPAHPYAAGEHRGIDIAADASEAVLAPAAGTVTFSGTVPGSGRALTITTADGLAVTLTHLGSLSVAAGTPVAEGQPVGAVGPSGDPEVAGPYLHLGIRLAAEVQGYRDPLSFLPARGAAPAAPGAAPVAPGPAAPAPAAAPAATPEAPAVPAAPATAVAVAAPPVPAPDPSPAAAVPDPSPPAGTAVADPPPATTAGGLSVRAALPVRAPAAPAHETRVVRPQPRVVSTPSSPPPVVHAAPAVARPRVASSHAITRSQPRVAASRPADPGVVAADARRGVATAPRAAAPSASGSSRHRPFHIGLVLLALLALGAGALAGAQKVARIIGRHGFGREEDPRGAGVALCVGLPAPGARGGVRAVRRVRALSPAQGQRRAGGERHRRARHAGDGGRRRGREVLP
jgi:hypothetical protein